jgi:Met-10+ like-protein
MESLNVEDDGDVFVVLVESKNAKQAKTKLKEDGLLHKSYRMTAASCKIPTFTASCVAIPLIEIGRIEADVLSSFCDEISIVGFGRQHCPLSTSLLGNSNQSRCLRSCDGIAIHETLVQKGVTKAVSKFWLEASAEQNKNKYFNFVKERLFSLDTLVCPKTLQYLGDDKTIVIPLRAFDIHRDETFQNFVSFVIRGSNRDINDVETTYEDFVTKYLWEALALVFNSPRVVRRGEIDPSSKIRLSEYKILWTQLDSSSSDVKKVPVDGSFSAGWIRITEQGIRQSFDLTKVMFSRGNITEKIRFGQLVQPREIVLDMYAGIGYFTLPALVHGGADLVVCCEWNEEAGKYCKTILISLHEK